jgi:TonB family protein
MFLNRLFALNIAIIISTLPGPALSDDTAACTQTNSDLDQRIAACSNVIAANNLDEQSKSQAFNSRGNAYYQKQDYNHAVADHTEAIRRNGYYAAAFSNRADSYWAKGSDHSAFVDCNEAIRLDPTNAELFVNRGAKYLDKGDLDAAIADFDQAIRLDPKLGSAYQIRGRAYSAKGNLDRAIADYDQVLRIEPSNALALAVRTMTYEAKGVAVATFKDYMRVVSARLEINKRYPHQARVQKEEGVAKVGFRIDREGKVIESHVLSGSGYFTLDQEALAMVQRAHPFPAPPTNQSKDHYDFVIPIRFKLP